MCKVLKANIAWQSFLENNLAQFLDELWVKIIQILSSRWWCLITATSALYKICAKTIWRYTVTHPSCVTSWSHRPNCPFSLPGVTWTLTFLKTSSCETPVSLNSCKIFRRSSLERLLSPALHPPAVHEGKITNREIMVIDVYLQHIYSRLLL